MARIHAKRDKRSKISSWFTMNMLLRNPMGKHLFCQVRFKSRIVKDNFPVLNPEELEEKFTLGSDTGGQAANKTANAVFFKKETRKKEKVF